MGSKITNSPFTFEEAESVRWFRGFSTEQKSAIDQLLYALRDDIEQGSTYRVRHCLSQLGLHPMVSTNELRLLMDISHGNDLAFLWFIWEAHYKPAPLIEGELKFLCNEESNELDFTVNEQLLLSAIARLDMPATLRELDRILPPASHSIQFQDQTSAKTGTKCKKESIETYNYKSKKVPEEYVLPYFQKMTRPKQYIPKANSLKRKVNRLQFPEYKCLQNKMYQIPNESSRWFTQYSLRPARRVVKRLLTQEIDRLFIHDNPIVMDTKSIALCEVHREYRNQLLKNKQRLIDDALVRCQRRIDIPAEQQHKIRQRIISEIEREVECATARMQEQINRQLIMLAKLKNTACYPKEESCLFCSDLVSLPAKPRNKRSFSALMEGSNKNFVEISRQNLPAEEGMMLKVMALQRDEQRPHNRCGAGDCILVDATPNKVDSIEHETRGSRKKRRTGSHGRSQSRMRSSSRSDSRGSSRSSSYSTKNKSKKDSEPVPAPEPIVMAEPTSKFQNLKDLMPVCGHTDIPLSGKRRSYIKKKSTTKLLTAAKMKHDTFTSQSILSTPQLNYFKVFDLPGMPELTEGEIAEKELDGNYAHTLFDKKTLIKEFCDEAVKEVNFEENSYKTLDATANRYSYFDSERKPVTSLPVQEKIVVKNKTSIQNNAHCANLSQTHKLLQMKNIDPNDSQLICDLLKAALAVMKDDRHFVLASFPNLHKLPMLLDWVAHRYGKTYSNLEIENITKTSYWVFDALTRKRESLAPPHKKLEIGSISYAQYKHFMCHVDKMKEVYIHKLRKVAMRETRLIWLALRGYSDLGGNIADTFFAYMPAYETAVRRYEWNSNNYRKMTEIRREMAERRK